MRRKAPLVRAGPVNSVRSTTAGGPMSAARSLAVPLDSRIRRSRVATSGSSVASSTWTIDVRFAASSPSLRTDIGTKAASGCSGSVPFRSR